MPLTPAQLAQLIQSMSFGYLSGQDLTTWADAIQLQTQLNKDPTCLQRGVNTAIAELRADLRTRYNLAVEYGKVAPVTPSAVATVTAGAVTGLSLASSSGGNGFASAPTVAFGGPGTGAAATAQVSASSVTSVTVLAGGCRYNIPPIVSISGGGGTGATAISVLDLCGRVLSITITNGGTGFTSAPSVTITAAPGDFGQGAIAVATVSFGVITGFTITTPGTGYTTAPLVTLSGGLALDLRDLKVVKLTSLMSIRNIFGNFQSLSEKLKGDLAQAQADVYDIRAGEGNLEAYEARKSLASEPRRVLSSFKTLG